MRTPAFPLLLQSWTLATLALAADQGTKAYFRGLLLPDGGITQSIALHPNFSLTPVWNEGISFGLFGEAGYWVIVFVTGALTLLIAAWLLFERHFWAAWGLALVLGGATGNLMDRLRHGAVFDFLDIHVDGWRWPTFNGADIAINLGVGIIMLGTWRDRAGEQAP